MKPNTSSADTSPVGAIISEGSSGVHLTDRDAQVVQLIGSGLSYKRTARTLGLATQTVRVYAHRIAARIPGNGSPQLKIAAWYWEFGATINGKSAD